MNVRYRVKLVEYGEFLREWVAAVPPTVEHIGEGRLRVRISTPAGDAYVHTHGTVTVEPEEA